MIRVYGSSSEVQCVSHASLNNLFSSGAQVVQYSCNDDVEAAGHKLAFFVEVCFAVVGSRGRSLFKCVYGVASTNKGERSAVSSAIRNLHKGAAGECSPVCSTYLCHIRGCPSSTGSSKRATNDICIAPRLARSGTQNMDGLVEQLSAVGHIALCSPQHIRSPNLGKGS